MKHPPIPKEFVPPTHKRFITTSPSRTKSQNHSSSLRSKTGKATKKEKMNRKKSTLYTQDRKPSSTTVPAPIIDESRSDSTETRSPSPSPTPTRPKLRRTSSSQEMASGLNQRSNNNLPRALRWKRGSSAIKTTVQRTSSARVPSSLSHTVIFNHDGTVRKEYRFRPLKLEPYPPQMTRSGVPLLGALGKTVSNSPRRIPADQNCQNPTLTVSPP